MKKTLIAVAALAATGAFAQNVTVTGTVDAGVAFLSGADTSKMGMTTSGLGSAQLIFAGQEDLGNGMKASFHLNGQIYADDGNQSNGAKDATVDSGQGFNFARRSTVSLSGDFGEIRLGRDYAPSFWNATVFDPFGTNGIAQSAAAGYTTVRNNNSVGYFLAAGPIYGQLQYAFGELTGDQEDDDSGAVTTMKNYIGARGGFKSGPMDVAVAFGQTSYPVDDNNRTELNVGGSFDLGMAKIIAQYLMSTVDEETNSYIQVGATAPVGSHLVKAAIGIGSNSEDDDATFTKIGLGYIVPMSSRTSVYAHFATIANGKTTARAVGSTGLAGMAAADESSSGFEFGVNHRF